MGKLNGGTLILVPGIMGSALRLTGTDSTGVTRNKEIWGENGSAVWNEVTKNPKLLASTPVVATKVLRQFNYPLSFKTKPLYGELMDFCCAPKGLGLKLDDTFRPFAYDWRCDLRDTAVELDRFVEKAPEPVFIVAHSMGGLVTRLMLNAKPLGQGASRVRGVFQIASPLAGSSHAFISLKNKPSFGPLVQFLWMLKNNFNTVKTAQDELMSTLRSMKSLYQLLPSMEILISQGGKPLSALDHNGWDRSVHSLIDGAIEVHKLLTETPTIPIKCIYGYELKTACTVIINELWEIEKVEENARGDGTVTEASASAASTDSIPLRGLYSEHNKLCSCQDVHDELRKFLL